VHRNRNRTSSFVSVLIHYIHATFYVVVSREEITALTWKHIII